jgi:alanine-glyoxylate transaminase/serine-glyoxylate transaminase/serine-pyruvate transaminase
MTSIQGSGVQLLQVPGPTNLPGRVLRALSRPLIDHRGPEFAQLAQGVMADLSDLVGSELPVALFPASGTGGWEAALVNTLSRGARILAFDHGFFASKWQDVARALGFEVVAVECDWRRPLDPARVSEVLEDTEVDAVLVVHNETSTGVLNPVREIRAALDRLTRPPLLIVDVISSLGSTEYRHDEWGIDVTVGASQKGLMLPPGLSFNAVSERALAAAEGAGSPKSYWDWRPMLAASSTGMFPYTPSTSLLFGLREALDMLEEAGCEATFARHARHAEATRRAVVAWGLELFCAEPAACSPTLTAVMVPDDIDADALRSRILERYGMALGAGLGKLHGKLFRIGHLGDFNDLMLCATLSGVELGLRACGAGPVHGVQAALDCLAGELRVVEDARAQAGTGRDDRSVGDRFSAKRGPSGYGSPGSDLVN